MVVKKYCVAQNYDGKTSTMMFDEKEQALSYAEDMAVKTDRDVVVYEAFNVLRPVKLTTTVAWDDKDRLQA